MTLGMCVLLEMCKYLLSHFEINGDDNYVEPELHDYDVDRDESDSDNDNNISLKV
jgi:hypothetical protein